MSYLKTEAQPLVSRVMTSIFDQLSYRPADNAQEGCYRRSENEIVLCLRLPDSQWSLGYSVDKDPEQEGNKIKPIVRRTDATAVVFNFDGISWHLTTVVPTFWLGNFEGKVLKLADGNTNPIRNDDVAGEQHQPQERLSFADAVGRLIPNSTDKDVERFKNEAIRSMCNHFWGIFPFVEKHSGHWASSEVINDIWELKIQRPEDSYNYHGISLNLSNFEYLRALTTGRTPVNPSRLDNTAQYFYSFGSPSFFALMMLDLETTSTSVFEGFKGNIKKIPSRVKDVPFLQELQTFHKLNMESFNARKDLGTAIKKIDGSVEKLASQEGELRSQKPDEWSDQLWGAWSARTESQDKAFSLCRDVQVSYQETKTFFDNNERQLGWQALSYGLVRPSRTLITLFTQSPVEIARLISQNHGVELYSTYDNEVTGRIILTAEQNCLIYFPQTGVLKQGRSGEIFFRLKKSSKGSWWVKQAYPVLAANSLTPLF